MLHETSINNKIRRYLAIGEEAFIEFQQTKNTDFFTDGKLKKIHLISNYVDCHKKCLMDFCLMELYKIINDFLIIKQLDNSRLLFLQRKLNKCQKIIFQMMNIKKKSE